MEATKRTDESLVIISLHHVDTPGGEREAKSMQSSVTLRGLSGCDLEPLMRVKV